MLTPPPTPPTHPPTPTPLQTYAVTALVVIAVLNKLPIKLLPQRGAGRRHTASTQAQVRGRCSVFGPANARPVLACPGFAIFKHCRATPRSDASPLCLSAALPLCVLMGCLSVVLLQEPITFADVAGVDEAKEELKEIVVSSQWQYRGGTQGLHLVLQPILGLGNWPVPPMPQQDAKVPDCAA